LKNNEVNEKNIQELFFRFEQFFKFSDKFKFCSEKLIGLSNSLKIPGKYVFRQENFSTEFLKLIRVEEAKLKSERHKFFEYMGSDTLNIDRELLLVIPMTNCVFSYNKNSYRKVQANFDFHNLKLKTFLPGCSTVHLKESFFITGGEIKDEGTRFYLSMNIRDKNIRDLGEMNYARRFHSSIAIFDRYLCVIGGWKSNEVEIIDTTQENGQWKVLASMLYSRSDCTPFLHNEKYLYVFGGWCFNNKECVSEVERLEIFDNRTHILKQNAIWEVVSVKNNKFLIAKYNMGIIPIILFNKDAFTKERILLVGGFDDEYDYSSSIVIIDITKKSGNVNVKKEVNASLRDESSFWYDKQFHIIPNENEDETIAVNFNCFNNIYAYCYKKNEIRLYINTAQNI
jgi:hypothetical protein